MRALGANIDITESHRRQVELETLSVRFDIATRAAQAGVWEWQEETDEIWWNETMFAIYGVSAATFRPTYGNVCRLIHPDDLAHAEAAWGEAVRLPPCTWSFASFARTGPSPTSTLLPA